MIFIDESGLSQRPHRRARNILPIWDRLPAHRSRITRQQNKDLLHYTTPGWGLNSLRRLNLATSKDLSRLPPRWPRIAAAPALGIVTK